MMRLGGSTDWAGCKIGDTTRNADLRLGSLCRLTWLTCFLTT